MTHEVEVLILTAELDFATDRICRALGERGVRYLRLNREHIPQLGLTLDPVLPELRCTHLGQRWRIGRVLRAVWWRQGTFDRFATTAASIQDQMIRSQGGAFMRSMMVFDQARWLNPPAATYRAETKAVQLLEADRLGFDVPATVMTNDPADGWAGPGDQEVALKSIDTLLLRDGEDQFFGYTTLTRADAVATEELRAAPATVQKAVRNKLDLRVTVLGERWWCASIGRAGRGVEGDWRVTSKAELDIQAYDLPAVVAERCVALVRQLGLVYGAIDLAVAEGRHWFIEINPTGEWGWLDADRSISTAIAEELACAYQPA